MQLNLFETEEHIEENKETILCRKCETHKPLDSFNNCAVEYETQERKIGARGVTGTARYCKECRDDYTRSLNIAKKLAPRRPNGLTECQCCERKLDGSEVHLDHDHITGSFRGWLCRRCNTGIGSLGDNIEGLEQAITYLRKANEQSSKKTL